MKIRSTRVTRLLWCARDERPDAVRVCVCVGKNRSSKREPSNASCGGSKLGIGGGESSASLRRIRESRTTRVLSILGPATRARGRTRTRESLEDDPFFSRERAASGLRDDGFGLIVALVLEHAPTHTIDDDDVEPQETRLLSRGRANKKSPTFWRERERCKFRHSAHRCSEIPYGARECVRAIGTLRI